MTIEMSRRRFIIGASVAAAGLLLPESEGLDRQANRNDLKVLRAFLDQPIENLDVTRPSTANLLAHIGRRNPSEVGFAHNANTLEKFEKFMGDEMRQVAELDCRVNEKGLYIAHNRGGKSDIDPPTAYDIVVSSPNPKALKYDCKEPEAVREIIDSIEDTERSCILNADLFHNSKFDLTPEQLVEQSEGLTNALLSIGRKGDFGDMEGFVLQFINTYEEAKTLIK